MISRSLHVYFTTFDMILKYILTYTCKISPPINPVKQYTNFKVRPGHVSLVVKISLHTPFCGGCGKCSFEKNRKRWILERFVVYFNIILS